MDSPPSYETTGTGKHETLENRTSNVKPHRNWKVMSNEERLNYVWGTYGEDVTPSKLHKIDSRAYQYLSNRDLLRRLKSGKR